ncbi:unnamed protein product, partial [Fusarium graminearum]
RTEPLDNPELDLIMVPTDGSFTPYESTTSSEPTSKTDGRIFVLKFSSSSQRHIFWLQSKPQSENGDAAYYSPRDRKIGDIGEEVEVAEEMATVRNDDQDDDEDEAMEDADNQRPREQRGSGGAGPDATGGDVREEGEGSREGGADGARAPWHRCLCCCEELP